VKQTRPLLLASASPRRREILSRLGLEFTVQAADLDESRGPGESPVRYVERLSRDKARAVADGLGSLAADLRSRAEAPLAADLRSRAEAPRAADLRSRAEAPRASTDRARAPSPASALLGADTTVVLDDQVLEKPRDLADSERMLRALRGREHVVYTAVTLLLWPESVLRTETVATVVRFRAFSDATLHGYVASREGMDKAGSYGIQDLGAALVSELRGSYSNVVGLPAAETLELLEQLGVVVEWP